MINKTTKLICILDTSLYFVYNSFAMSHYKHVIKPNQILFTEKALQFNIPINLLYFQSKPESNQMVNIGVNLVVFRVSSVDTIITHLRISIRKTSSDQIFNANYNRRQYWNDKINVIGIKCNTISAQQRCHIVQS